MDAVIKCINLYCSKINTPEERLYNFLAE